MCVTLPRGTTERRAYRRVAPRLRVRRGGWAAIALAIGLMCTSQSVGSATAGGTSADLARFGGVTTVRQSASSEPPPRRIRIPSIHVNTRLVRLGLDKEGSLEEPTTAARAGWFVGAPRPGQLGPAIIAGHVHWNGRPAVFAKLGRIRYDDRIIVTRRDGTEAVFSVTRVSRFKKSGFPTSLVYGDTDHSGLRLITCSGFDQANHAYLDNVVVFAVLVTVRQPVN